MDVPSKYIVFHIGSDESPYEFPPKNLRIYNYIYMSLCVVCCNMYVFSYFFLDEHLEELIQFMKDSQLGRLKNPPVIQWFPTHRGYGTSIRISHATDRDLYVI